MRRYRVAVLVMLSLVAAGRTCAAAGDVQELWRSRYGTLRAGVANPSDGSLWLVEGATVTHLAEDGTLLFRSRALGTPYRLALAPTDGSCWVYEAKAGQFLHFSADGVQLGIVSDQVPSDPHKVLFAASPIDGSLWIAEAGHFDAQGKLIFGSPWNASTFVLDAEDGSAWAVGAGTQEAVHVRGDGTELLRVQGITSVLAEDPRDHSVWGADTSGRLVHFSAAGALLATVTQPADVQGSIIAAAASPLDSSVWVTYSYFIGGLSYDYHAATGMTIRTVVHYSVSGEDRGRCSPLATGVLSDGSVWTGGTGGGLAQISADGQELRRLPSPQLVLAYQPADNSFWGLDRVGTTPEVALYLRHISQDGSVPWQSQTFSPVQLPGRSVDARDGSCWVLDWPIELPGTEDFVRISAAGVEVERRHYSGTGSWPLSLGVSPLDGSWWLTEGQTLIRFSPEGAELWRRDKVGGTVLVDPRDGSAWAVQGFYDDEFGNPYLHGSVFRYRPDGVQTAAAQFPALLQAPAVDPTDGSLWFVATDEQASWRLVRLSTEGGIMADMSVGGQFSWITALAVSPSDGSVYGVGSLPGVVFRMSRDGTVLWTKTGFSYPSSIALDPRDGSAWVAVTGDINDTFGAASAVVHLAADGTELWRERTVNKPTTVEFSPHDGTVWVTDYGNLQLVHVGPQAGLFSDVPAGFWAASEIEACVTAGVVTGFPDGSYQPEAAVTRDQMAVFVARALAGGETKVPSGPATASFGDVSTHHWAFRHVEFCQAEGIVTGYPDGLYHPLEEVTRAQMAVFITRAFVESPTAPATAVFPDVPADYWAAKYIAYSRDQGIVKGYPDGTYHPEDVVDRAQMAVYVARAFDLAP